MGLFFGKRKPAPGQPSGDWPWTLNVSGALRPNFGTWEMIVSELRELNLDSWLAYEPESLSPLEELPVEELSLGNLFPRDGSWRALGRMGRLKRLWLWDPPWAALAVLVF